jgi:hypothetical protein
MLHEIASGEILTDLPASALLWATSVQESNIDEFQILDFDESGVVSTAASPFYLFKKPQTLAEWVSLYFFVVATYLASCTELADGATSLRGRARAFVEMCRSKDGEHAPSLVSTVRDVLVNSPGAEAAIWTSAFFHAATQLPLSTSPLVGEARLYVLVSRYIGLNHHAIARNVRKFGGMRLSVAKLLPDPADLESNAVVGSKRRTHKTLMVSEEVDWSEWE